MYTYFSFIGAIQLTLVYYELQWYIFEFWFSLSKTIFTSLGVPEVLLKKHELEEDKSMWFTMTIKSVPVPDSVQWYLKKNGSETFEKLNANAVEYKGTSNAFPHPVLVIRKIEKIKNYSYKLEVKNLIGEVNPRTSGNQ